MTVNGLYILITVLGLLLTLATGAGAYFAFRTSRDSRLVDIYKGTANAWKERAEAYSEQIRELQAQNAEQASQIADLNGKMTLLKDLVTGSSVVGQLADGQARILERLERTLVLLGEHHA